VLDATSAREAALRDGGIRAVITGSVAGPVDRPAIEVRIVAPVSGAAVATIKEASIHPATLASCGLLKHMRPRWYALATGTARSKSCKLPPQTGGP
jgi:hypothetical protein